MEFVWILVGMIVGFVVTAIIFYIRSGVGTLRIDRSNPAKEKWLFDVGNLDKLTKKKHIILKIDNNADLSDLSQK